MSPFLFPVAPDPHATAVDPASWRKLTLRAETAGPDGAVDVWEVQTLRPAAWLEQRDLGAGDTLDLSELLDLREMGVPQGVSGRVVTIDACPAIAAGEGRVVLTTVSHPNDDVHELVLRGPDGREETLGVTGWHKFYQEGIGWRSVRELREGDTLRGRGGETVTVVNVALRPGAERVYNLTVEADHVYHVGQLDTLTHNQECRVAVRQADGSLRIGETIQDKNAIRRLERGLDVHAPSRADAISIQKRARGYRQELTRR